MKYPLALCVAILAAVASPVAGAQQYPSKAVRLVVPLAPGGGADTLARYLAKHLTEALGQQVVVENRPGGGGVVGGEFAARAAPDGYTLMIGGSGQLVVTMTHRKPDIREDFTAISGVLDFPSLLMAHPSLPVRTVADLIKLAKARPGQINYGSPGIGSAGHLNMEMLRSAAGIDIVHVPYRGAGPALTDVMAGQVQLLFSNPLGGVGAVKAGRVRAIAVSGKNRLSTMPDVPTIAESGIPGYETTSFLGLLGPAGMPREIVMRLNSDTVKSVQRRDFQEWLAQQGAQPAASTPEAFAAKIKSEMDKLVKVVREARIKLD
jgi:tripartite-type tricarboxylate transporter receptor subunit TctC